MADNKKRILVIDDEPDMVAFISTVLEDAGYDTATASDGVEALKELKAATPDLITLDITMPNKSGVKFYREVKEDENWKSIPVVIITGVSGDFQKFISTRRQVPPPEGYISKPLGAPELVSIVGKLIGDLS